MASYRMHRGDPQPAPNLPLLAAELSCRMPCQQPAAALPPCWLASRGGGLSWLGLVTPAVPCDHAHDSAGRRDQGRQCLGQCKDVQHRAAFAVRGTGVNEWRGRRAVAGFATINYQFPVMSEPRLKVLS
jgi:hypothetical protein